MSFTRWQVSDEAMDIPPFPGTDIEGGGVQNGHVFCGHHPNLGGAIFISPLQVTEIVRAGVESLGTVERAQIATWIGALTPEQADEIHAELERKDREIAALKENLTVPLADVIDFFEEKAKRRPEVEAAPAS